LLCALTLFVLMMLTGRIRWSVVFAKRDTRVAPAPSPATTP
jgi:hypothetical protein